MLLLYLQAATIVVWEGAKWPWDDLLSSHCSESKDIQVRVLTIFITWAALRFLQSLLDIGTQFRRAFRDGRMLAVCMVLNVVVAAAWVIAFLSYTRRSGTRGQTMGSGRQQLIHG
jgi:callose synthase